ncbi:cytidine deaminase [Embleya sp. NPDC055664]|uniref:Cytidine deaminase n=1 Tax=Embleya scabrispora TaxID=159449 RepID=A0A1T3P2A5_9ACTN|nr:cytidine deaminase [Embleya scabrispora]OPC83082.1 cytidine deaminase [Embleya scabrispora]
MSAETPEFVVDPEDAKIVTLARATRARNGASEGAAVRDETGRTYTASTVALPSLELSALRTAVAMAVAGGARGLEAAAIVGADDTVTEADRDAVRDLGGAGTPILSAGPDAVVRTIVTV